MADFNPYEGATALAQAIAQFQKQQRVNPVAAALQDMSSRYGQAQTDSERTALNAAANATRQGFLQSGGSPYELDTRLWGAEPGQGFQTGAEAFTPGYAGDDTTTGQKMKLAALTGMFAGQPTFDRQMQLAQLTGMYEGRPTWQRQYAEAGLTGMYGDQPTWQREATEAGLTGTYQGKPTWEREYQERQLALAAMKGLGGGGGSDGSSSGSASGPTTINQRATQQAIAQVWSYGTPEEAFTAYGHYGPDMAVQGVDLSKVWNEMKKRWPDYKEFNKSSGSGDDYVMTVPRLGGGGE